MFGVFLWILHKLNSGIPTVQQKMSSYNSPGYHPANIHREHPEPDLKDAAVRRSKRIKKRQLTDKQDIHLEKRTKNTNWDDVEVVEKKENHKTQRGKFKCDQCSYATNRCNDLKNHKILRHKSEEDIVWYKCPKCPKKLKLKGQLKEHLQDAHDEVKKWFTCAHCSFKTKEKSSLNDHEITRHAPSESIKWFHCTQCDDYKARTKKLLQQHVKRKHDQLFFRCDYCPYRSNGRDALKTHKIREHEDSIKWMKCDKCGQKFKNEAGLRYHNRIHKTDEFNERMGTSEMDILNGYSCSLCEFKTLDRVEFAKHPHKTRADKTHLEKQTNNKNWADVEVEEDEEEEEENHKTQTGKFKCDQCSFATNWRSTLNQHNIVHHKSEEDIVWYKCPKCPKKLKLKGQLKQHLKQAHDEVKEWFTCAHCPFKTKEKKYLANHEITRHAPSESIKWFYCTQCDDYKGRTKKLLQQHVKRKHDQLFFTCNYCLYRSRGRRSLRTHEIAEHEDCIKWMKCDKCGKKFKDEMGLRCHNNRIHKTAEFNERLGIAIASKEYLCPVCQFKTLDRVEFDKHSHDIKRKSDKLL